MYVPSTAAIVTVLVAGAGGGAGRGGRGAGFRVATVMAHFSAMFWVMGPVFWPFFPCAHLENKLKRG